MDDRNALLVAVALELEVSAAVPLLVPLPAGVLLMAVAFAGGAVVLAEDGAAFDDGATVAEADGEEAGERMNVSRGAVKVV